MVTQNDTQNTDNTLNETARGSENFLRWSTSAMLRGGRVTKFKGIAASYSPELGLVSSGPGAVADGGRGSTTLSLARRLLRWSAAPVALLATQSPAFAQAQDACVEVSPNNFVCEDNGDAATTEQDLFRRGEDVTVLLQDGFEVDTTVAGGDGIDISGAQNVVITQESGSSTITGGRSGLDVLSATGDVSITTGGNVTGVTSRGIYVSTSGDNITIDSTAGSVSGGYGGIRARASGSGAVSITTAGVAASSGVGIEVDGSGSDVTLDTRKGAVSGGGDGIDVRNDGAGDTSITTADVTGEVGDGIYAYNLGADLTIDSSAGTVTGQETGVLARNYGTGDTSVTTADVTGTTGNGISARNEAGSGSLAIDTSGGAVTSFLTTIDARNYGTGVTTIVTGDVTAAGFETRYSGEYGTERLYQSAVYANSDETSTSLTIDSTGGTLTASGSGVSARHNGSGSLTITTGDVVGGAGDGVSARSNGGDIIIDTAAGNVSGSNGGIFVTQSGTGATTVTTGNVTSGFFFYQYGGGFYPTSAISITHREDSQELTLDTTQGTILGTGYGIATRNEGAGDTTIATADVTGTESNGIFARHTRSSTGDLIIDTTAGAVTGGEIGIEADNEGTGSTTITTADVTGTTGDGIFAENAATAADIAINTTAGVVAGGDDGIQIRNDGGSVSVVTGDVNAFFQGVSVYNASSSGDVTIDTSGGALVSDGGNGAANTSGGSDGGADGILVGNLSSGNTTITTGDVTVGDGTGIGGDGIRLSTAAGGLDITINTAAGAITAGEDGIDVTNGGSGETTITTADVTGLIGDGINVENAATAGNLTIDTTAGAVSGGSAGIDVDNAGTGNTSITTADVTGTNASGIEATNRAGTGTLTIDTSAGAVTGGQNGLDLLQQGTGDVAITTGDVTGLGANGVYLRVGYDFTGDIVINTAGGAVTGNNIGINANNVGTGSLTITTADVTGETFAGISAREDGENGVEGADITINTTAGTVTGATDGIFADNIEAGDLSITTADVVGTAEDGIFADNDAGTGNLTIDTSAGAVTGANNGIYASNGGSGDTSITTANVTGTNFDGVGINVANAASAGNLAVDSTAGAISSVSTGIFARNNGTGTLTLRSGDVSSGGPGVYAASRGTDIAIDTSAGAVTSEDDGVRGVNRGTGDMTITTGDVTSNNRYGILANNGFEASPGGANLIVDSSAGTVIGATDGVIARNNGTGDTTITTGDVTGTNADGVDVYNGFGTNNLTIDTSAGAVTGGIAGINAVQYGSGSTTITTAGVDGGTNDGIAVQNDFDSSGLTINTSAGSVSGGLRGIDVRNYGRGDASITTGSVTGGSGDGVYVYAEQDVENLTIDTTAGAVTGGSDGIDVNHQGFGGSVSITTSDVSGRNGDGIRANSYNDIVINSAQGSVSGANAGIDAYAYFGSVAITTANVSGTSGDGIYVRNSYDSSADITIDSSAGAVTGGDDGIDVYNRGYASTQVVTGDVTGQSGAGLRVADYGEGSFGADTISINSAAGTVTGATDGIIADNRGFGDLAITTADVTGASGDGINAVNTDASTGSLTIDSSAGAVTGGDDGIDATNAGTGDTAVITANVSGLGDDGVYVVNDDTAGSLTIDTTAGVVFGFEDGVYARNNGTGDTRITTSDVSGGGNIGVGVAQYGAGNVIIDSTGGTVSAADNGFAGVYVYNIGTGSTQVVTADVSGDANDGIRVYNGSETTDLTIDSSAGAVFGTEYGIYAANNGTGETNITTADVTGTSFDGIKASNANASGNIVIDSSAGAVSGGADGIDVFNNAPNQSVSIIAGDVTGQTGNGIVVNEYGEAGFGAADITINSAAGSVSGATYGISARNVGTGDLSITTAGVTGAANSGISAINQYGTGDLTIDSSAGAVSGGFNGVSARNNGTGVTRITTADVTAADDAVFVSSEGTDVFVDTTAGAVSGTRGIVALVNQATGLTSITTGDVTSVDDAAITVSTDGTDLIIDTTAGSVTNTGTGTYVSGIDAANSGTGSTVVTTANVSSENGFGVDVSNGLDATDLTLDTTAGAVSGGTDGVRVNNRGTGVTSVTTADVTGGALGVYVEAGEAAGDIVVNTSLGSVTGGSRGVVIQGNDDAVGDVSVTTADVTAQEEESFAVVAYGSQGNVTVDTSAGTVSGGGVGVAAISYGGTVSITTADVSASGGSYGEFGFGVVGYSLAGDVVIDTTAGSVDADVNGVAGAALYDGSVTITTANVDAEFGAGITAIAQDGDITIDSSAGSVTAGQNAIEVNHGGAGSVSITTSDLTATGGDGIYARADGAEGDVMIDTSAGTVTGASNGIFIFTEGAFDGQVSITTGNVIGQGDYGIAVRNFTGSSVTIDSTAGAVTGEISGVSAVNAGPGDLSITTAAVTGSASDGINGYNTGSSANLTIDSSAGAVSGGIQGINARNRGTGNTSITTADVTGGTGNGIYAVNEAGSGDLAVDTSAGSVSGGSNAIAAVQQGTGSVSITTGNLTAAGGDGVNLVTDAESDTLVIDTSAGATLGSDRGIYANHAGSGDLTITVGNVTGEGAEGILASTTQDSANIILTGGTGVESNVVGATTGIALTSAGADITVSGLDSVTGQAGDGLNLVSNGGDIAVSDIGTITGLGGNGIFADADSGNIVIDNVGAVDGITATGGIAIAAYADNGGSVTIGTSGAVSGETYGVDGSASGDVTIDTTNYGVTGAIGIRAVNSGAGATSVTTANVTGTGGEGINASTTGTDVTVNTLAGTVTGVTDGIVAENTGTGETAITAADVTGTTGDGINASTAASAGDLAIDTTAGTVAGGQNGIVADHDGTGDLILTTADIIGEAGDGIVADNNAGGATTIDTSAGSVTGGQDGIDVVHRTADALTVTAADVSGTARDGISVFGQNAADITIDSTAGTVAGGMNGIDVANFGNGELSIVTANVTGGADGIDAASYGSALSIDTTAGTVTGGTNGIYARNFSTSEGAISIVTGDVTGTTGNGIEATENGEVGAYGADITIDSTLGTVTGGTNGIFARNADTGDLEITTANVASTDGQGINAQNAAGTGDLAINSAAGSVSGAISGILARNEGTGLTSVVAGDVTGTDGAGIDASNAANAGDLAIDSTAGTVTGGTNGIAADNDGAGELVLTAADIIGEAGDGISADNAGTNLAIDSSAGSVSGSQNGIAAANNGSGSLSVTAANVTGTAAAGISASNAASGTDLSIDSTAGTVTGGTNGIAADNDGTGELVLTAADIIGEAGDGIAADNAGTNLAIDSTAGSVSGGQNGIAALNNGSGSLSVTAANVTGTAAAGISASNAASGTDLSIDSSAGTVTGGTNGIAADNDGTGELVLTTADIIGEAGDGIAADNAGTNLAIDSSAGSVSGGANGIAAVNNGSGSLSVTSANVTGTAGAGISASNAATAGDLSIDSSAGTVTGAAAGIFADQLSAGRVTMLVDQVTGGVGIDSNAASGDTLITLGSTAVVTGTSGFGIDARSAGGNVTVQGSSGSVIGAADGIYVRPTTGDITISTIDRVEGQAGDGLDLLTQGGNITVTDIGVIIGTGGNGVTANAGGGVIDVQTAGDITGSLAGVVATTTGAGTINLSVGGTTTGTQNGLDVSTDGGAVAITNSGSLSGGDFAVLASGPGTGSITLDNTGTLSSAIQFAAADDSFTNSGTFAAAGTSDFGDGDDTLVSTGTIAVTGAAQFDRLETLQSGGTLSLADGAATGTFTTSGDFVGTGGDVVLDVDFASGSADQLIIGGAATGTTTLALNAISSGFSFNQEFVVVQAGAGTEEAAFVLGDGQQITPFLNADLSFDAVANTFSFEVALSERVFEGTKIAENAQALWYRSTDAWADHRAGARANAGAGTGEGTPVWVVAYGASANRDETFRDRAGLGLNDAALDYSQDFFGLQGGADYALGDALTLGVTGGFLSSTARQDENGNQINFDTLNIGLSASYAAGAFFADALVKFDSISGDLSDPTGTGFNGTLDGQAFGLRAQAGYRFGDASFYVEPNAAFDLQKTDLDDLVIEGQTFVFDNVNGARGTAGIRFGGESKTASGANIGYYLGTNLVHEFDGKADVRFIINGGEIGFQNNPIDTYGNLEAGISVDNGGPLSGFLQVESDLSKDYQSFGGKVGVRLKF